MGIYLAHGAQEESLVSMALQRGDHTCWNTAHRGEGKTQQPARAPWQIQAQIELSSCRLLIREGFGANFLGFKLLRCRPPRLTWPPIVKDIELYLFTYILLSFFGSLVTA